MSSSEIVFGSLSKPLISGQFEWNINISSLHEKFNTTTYLDSPTFSFSHCSWFVRLYPKGVNSNGDWTSLMLIKKNSSQSEIAMSYAVDMTVQGTHLVHVGGYYTFKKSVMDGLRFDQFILCYRLSSLWLMPHHPLCNLLSIKIGLMHNVPCKEDSLLTVKKQGNEILHQNYKDLLLDDENHDLILKVKDKEFKAHQIILRFRCPVFKAMLSHDMLEKDRGVIEIPDCDPSAFEQFLFYIYTGNLEMLDESVMLGLYYIADKYDMSSLKEMCCEFIKKSLSTTNICDIISLALAHCDSPLLECGEKYFVDNASEVLVSTEWKSFIIENPNHVPELFLKVYNNCLLKDRSAPSGGNNVVNMPANSENNVGHMPPSRENNVAYMPANIENNIPYGLGPVNRENNIPDGPANRGGYIPYRPANGENNIAYGPANRGINIAYRPANGENNIAYEPENRENPEREYIMIE